MTTPAISQELPRGSSLTPEYRTLDALVGTIASEGLDSILLEQARQQRHTATMLRSVRRETQRQLIEAQAEKIMKAANMGIGSAVIGAALRIGATVAGANLSSLDQKLLNAMAEGAAAVNPCSYLQAQANADATRLGGAASIQGQLAQESGEMLQSATRLEQAMLRHLEKPADGENASRRAIIDKMGG